MTLQVAFEQFAPTVKRLLKSEEAYVVSHACGALATAAKSGENIVIASLTKLPPEGARDSLEKEGFSIFPGNWLTPEVVLTPDISPADTFIAAVSYRSSSDKEGVWVDAYP